MMMLSSLSSGLLCAFGQIYIYISVTGTEAAGAAAIDVKLRKRMNELEK